MGLPATRPFVEILWPLVCVEPYHGLFVDGVDAVDIDSQLHFRRPIWNHRKRSHTVDHENWRHKLMAIILSNLKRFPKFLHWNIPRQIWLNWLLEILAYVATLPCETLVSEKIAINDTLQGSVATYLRFFGTQSMYNVWKNATNLESYEKVLHFTS